MSYIVIDTSSAIDPVLRSWRRRIGIQPSDALMKDLNALIKGLRADGDLNKFDLLAVIGGMETDEQRLTPIITSSGLAMTAVNSPTLDNTGVTGNATSSYIDTNWNYSTSVKNYATNSGCHMIYCRTNVASVKVSAGAFNSSESLYFIRYTDGLAYFATNSNAGESTTSNTNSLGFFSSVRTNSTQASLYLNGLLLETKSQTSANMPALDDFICCYNNNGTAAAFSGRNYSLRAISSGEINQLNVYNRVQTYMTSRGIQV